MRDGISPTECVEEYYGDPIYVYYKYDQDRRKPWVKVALSDPQRRTKVSTSYQTTDRSEFGIAWSVNVAIIQAGRTETHSSTHSFSAGTGQRRKRASWTRAQIQYRKLHGVCRVSGVYSKEMTTYYMKPWKWTGGYDRFRIPKRKAKKLFKCRRGNSARFNRYMRSVDGNTAVIKNAAEINLRGITAKHWNERSRGRKVTVTFRAKRGVRKFRVCGNGRYPVNSYLLREARSR